MRHLFPFLFLLVFALMGCQEQDLNGTQNLKPMTIETPDGRSLNFEVEIAVTQEQQQRGLMYRESLPKDQGMLFIANPPREFSFWMKNTLISLDMIFIGPDGLVYKIHRNAQPHDTRSISSEGFARAILEINGGLSDELGLIEGSKAILP